MTSFICKMSPMFKLPYLVNTHALLHIHNSGPTALHLAARCGALDAVSCLLANYASLVVSDAEGWAPIHHAAFYDHEPVIRLIIRRMDGMLEYQTKNE